MELSKHQENLKVAEESSKTENQKHQKVLSEKFLSREKSKLHD